MTKKLVLFGVILACVGVALGLGALACSSSQASCKSDQDCKPDEYCGTDGKCHQRGIPDGENQDGGDGTDGDQQPGDLKQGCTLDRDCPPDKVCDKATGDCIAGSLCNYDYNCESGKYCHPEGKVCKIRSALCEPCNESYECPDPSMGDRCIDYPSGRFCGMRCGVQLCPAGYDCDLNAGSGAPPNPGQCRSNTGVCGGEFICHRDPDCAANKVCNLQTGRCVPKCRDDTACPSGYKCHLTGHCGLPCAADADCSVYGTGLICCVTPGVGFCGADSAGRCRPPGCVLHEECLLTQGYSLGYCDKRDHTCKAGCRWGSDLAAESDCRSGYRCKCVGGTLGCDAFDCCSDPGGACLCEPDLTQDCSQVQVCDNGACEKIPCNERQGGVHVACARNQVCCGYPAADGYPCPQAVPVGECYLAPKNVWCQICSQEGQTCNVAGYGYNEPGVCQTDGGDSNKYCHLACRTNDDCPATWACDYTYLQGCQSATDCQATATCELVYRGYDDQGQVQEANGCHCKTDADCPTDINGFRAYCEEYSICDYTVQPTSCHDGMVCMFAKACQCDRCCGELQQ